MNWLALDTSTEQLSVAVARSEPGSTQPAQVWEHRGEGGAQASSQLIPSIERLMTQGGLRYADLKAVVFGRGPGSFTGLRTACSVAQGLAFGAGVAVLPVDTLLCVAEAARWQYAPDVPSLRVLSLLDARMGELYAAAYLYQDGQWQGTGDMRLVRPQDIDLQGCDVLAGNVFKTYASELPQAASLLTHWPALPEASALLRLAPALSEAGMLCRAEEALPLYVRDKVAQTTAERLAAKMAPRP
jgi:tRNA threonylcarbamoyladenosine biosynthesis protein TsaB